jgi:rhamnogalacturonyl hydrolase YesR
MINEEPIKKWVKVGKDENTGLWYYENSRGVRSQAIFANRKKAWAKGNDYIDTIYHPKRKFKGGN